MSTNHRGVRPKLPSSIREHIHAMAQRRRILARLIAELLDEKRKIPSDKQLAKEAGVCYQAVRRVVKGEPYKNAHPSDVEAA